uniref:Cyclin-dependent serine/threonine-protein kinase DDB_G0292550 n=1 Tax=Strongyloides papillosus TaxID=174720 RepID=A0A0N5C4C1_STREA
MTDIPYSRPTFVYNNHRTYYIPNHSYNVYGNSSNYTTSDYLNSPKNNKTDDIKNSRQSIENDRIHTKNYSDINGFKKYYEKSYDKVIQSDLKRNTLAESTTSNYQKNFIKPLSYNSPVTRNYSTFTYKKPIFPSENSLTRKKDYIIKPAVPPRPSLYERNGYEKVPLVPERNHPLNKGYIDSERANNNNNNEIEVNKYQSSKEYNRQNVELEGHIKNSPDSSDINTSQRNTKSTNTPNSCSKNGDICDIIEKLSDLNFTSISCQEDNNDINTSDQVNIVLSFELANLKPVSTIERHARIIQWIHASSDYSHFPPTDDILTDMEDEINCDFMTIKSLCV